MIERIQGKLSLKSNFQNKCICFRLPSGERLEDMFDPSDSTKVCAVFCTNHVCNILFNL